MSEVFSEIKLSDIDLTDERYKISYSDNDISHLAASITVTGLLVPPIVRLLNHQYIIVSGFNRVRAMIHNRKTKISVIQVDPDTTDCQCLIKSIADYAFKRSLTLYEIVKSIRRLHEFMTMLQHVE